MPKKTSLKQIDLKNIVLLLIISVIFAGGCTSGVNYVAKRILPTKSVVLTVLPTNHSGNDVWIFDDANKNSLFEECKNGVKDGIWEYRDASEHGYAGNMIVSYSDNKGAIIRFSAKLEQNAYITFWKNSNSAVIMIEADGEKQTADLYSDVEGGEMLRIYPFAKSMLPVIVRGGIYCLLVAMLFTALFALEQEALEPRRSKLLGYAWKKWMIFPIWGVLYFIAVVEYKRGIPNFLKFGDQLYYWNVSLLDTNGKWNPAWLSENVIAFRGYLCQLLPTISKLIGNATGIDPVHIYFLFTSFAISWLTAYVLPMLYTELTKKSAHLLQVVCFLIVYMFFWQGTLTAVLVDMLGATCFFSGTLFAVRFSKKGHIAYAMASGAFYAAACNFRTAYQYGIYVMLVFFLILKIREAPNNAMEFRLCTYKKMIVGAIGFICAFLFVCLPQIQLNIYRGHVGLLPYDYVGAWTVDGSSRETSLLEVSAGQTISIGYTGYPAVISDDQMLTMKSQVYSNADILGIPQIMGVYMNNPLETVTYVGKKILAAFDTKTNITYPTQIFWRDSSGLVFSLLNYVVLVSAIYTLLQRKLVNEEERKLAASFLIGLVLPQMFVHVEWRYFLSSYILLYFFFSYHFVGEIITDSEEMHRLIKGKYLPILTITILIMLTVSLTLWA